MDPRSSPCLSLALGPLVHYPRQRIPPSFPPVSPFPPSQTQISHLFPPVVAEAPFSHKQQQRQTTSLTRAGRRRKHNSFQRQATNLSLCSIFYSSSALPFFTPDRLVTAFAVETLTSSRSLSHFPCDDCLAFLASRRLRSQSAPISPSQRNVLPSTLSPLALSNKIWPRNYFCWLRTDQHRLILV